MAEVTKDSEALVSLNYIMIALIFAWEIDRVSSLKKHAPSCMVAEGVVVLL